MEIWKSVVGYKGLYEISSMGRVKSFVRNPKGKILSLKYNIPTYIKVNLRGDGKRKTALLHRLVYEAFVGPIPNGCEVHHKDGNKQNNCISNLQCLSKTHHQAISPHNPMGMVRYNTETKIKDVEQWTLTGEYIATFKGFKAAAQATGICERNIAQVANSEEYKPGKVRKQAGGYVWRIKG